MGENGDPPPDALGVIDLNRESESDQFWAAGFVIAGLATRLT